MPRQHGYASAGQRCYGLSDWHAKGRTNVIGALIDKLILTVGLFKTNVNADIFYQWTVQDLLPKLPPASVVVMDNATFHKRADIRSAISNAGHTLDFIPAYSPGQPRSRDGRRVRDRSPGAKPAEGRDLRP